MIALSRTLARACLLLLAAIAPAAESAQIYRSSVEPVWIRGGAQFWYRNTNPGQTHEFILVDADRGERRPAFDHARVAQALGGDVRPEALPVELLEFTADENILVLHGREKVWELSLSTYALTEKPARETPAAAARAAGPSTPATTPQAVFINREGPGVTVYRLGRDRELQRAHVFGSSRASRWETSATRNDLWLVTDAGGKTLAVLRQPAPPFTATVDAGQVRVISAVASDSVSAKSVPSPDRSAEAFVRDHNLWIRLRTSGEEFPLTLDGSPGNSFRRDAVTERAISMRYDRLDYPETLPHVEWAPDGQSLLAFQTRAVPERRVYLVESSPADQLQPKQHSYPYLKPGDEIPTALPRLFSMPARKELPLDRSAFPTPWRIDRLHWTPDGKSVSFVYNQRGHQVLRVVAVDTATGATRVVIDEQSRTFIDYRGKYYCEQLDATDEIIWMSERDGWNHLYLYDRGTGRVKNQITHGEWVVREVMRVDAAARELLLLVAGVIPGQDPYYLHLARVGFDGSGFRLLTEANGTHTVRETPNRQYFVATASRVDAPPVSELRTRDGVLRLQLETAEGAEVLAQSGRYPERFVAPGRDGTTEIHGVIHWPKDFDPARKYPVVEKIYAGPHGFFVPKAFSVGHRDLGPLGAAGFIVVQIDGMGTSGRSKKFHDVAWQNLRDAGLPDRIAWMKAAAAKHPQIDLSRVGIYGGSAGGQNALAALLWHGDFYQAAVADCGCHDNRMDKIWWNELWLGWPVGPQYAANSNVEHAHRLQGKLLLSVGELDRNVDPASTYQVANALIKAGKVFDFVVIPGGGHGALLSGSKPGAPSYGMQRMIAFLQQHLGAPETLPATVAATAAQQ